MSKRLEIVRLADVAPVVIRLLSDYELQAMRWLWPHWLAQGKLHVLAGQPGTGKTTLALKFAATISTGGIWPDGSVAPQGDVLIWSGEDSVGDTLKPRLLAMGADSARIRFIHATRDEGGARPFDPATDMAQLGAAASQMEQLKFLVIDPVSAAIQGDSHKAGEVRAGLQPVVNLAERLDLGALGISHFAKHTSGRNPIERVVGSIAFTAGPRVVLATIMPADPSMARRLTRAKSNLGPDGGGFEYHLVQAMATEGDQSVPAQLVDWGAQLEGTARDLLGVEEPGEGNAIGEAGDFLAGLLAAGPVKVREVEAAARAHGHSWRTVERAKKEIGVKASKPDMTSGWEWSLPDKDQDRHV